MTQFLTRQKVLNSQGLYDGVAVSFKRLKLDNVSQVYLARLAIGVDRGPVLVQLATCPNFIQYIRDKLLESGNRLLPASVT